MKPVSFAIFSPAEANTAPPRAGGASLDVLRFLAASFILLFHYGSTAPRDLATILPVFSQGWLATDFFLLLSGYILARAYGRRLLASDMRRSHFFLRRFARLWPSHILVLLVFGAFVLASTLAGFPPQHPEKYSISAYVYQAFLVHGWGLVQTPAWNVPTWTISSLLICYALFSVYVPLLYNRPLAIMAVVGLIVLVIAHMIALNFAHHAFVDLPFAWGLLRAIPLFILGNLIERLTADIRVSKTVFWCSLVGIFAAITGLAMLSRHAATDSVILLLLGAVLAISGAVSFQETAVTKRMGRASWSLFLTHSLIGAIWFGLTPKLVTHFGLGMSAQWGLWFAGVALALVTAFAFDALIDTPLSQRVSKLSFVKGGV